MYTPGHPPAPDDSRAVVDAVWSELKTISAEFTVAEQGRGDISFNVPDKPQLGQFVFADGTHWNPGSGAGPYYYDGANWVSMTPVPTFVDSSFRVYDNGDNTKKLAFECSGITTGTTRTWTVPDFSDVMVGRDGVQTLKDKTFDTATNTTHVFKIGGTVIVTIAATQVSAPLFTGILNNTDGTDVFRTNINMANSAGANTATLTNAPVAGNPTKWISFLDNGVRRYQPAW